MESCFLTKSYQQKATQDLSHPLSHCPEVLDGMDGSQL